MEELQKRRGEAVNSTTVDSYQPFSPLAIPDSSSVSFFLEQPLNSPFGAPEAFFAPPQSTGDAEGGGSKWISPEDFSRLFFAAEFSGVAQRLDELAQLQSDWDSFGSDPPSETAVMTSKGLIVTVAAALQRVDQPLPFFIGPISGGGVQVEWRGPSGSIEVEVDADGGFNCLIARGSGTERRFEERHGLSLADTEELIASVVQ
jgi:hypothetical protein